jgi:hypothetical protein
MEGFTTLQSKNSQPTKSLPCRSAEPLLHSVRLSAPQAVPGHCPMPDPHMAGYPSLAMPASSSQTHTMPEYLPLGHAARSMTTGIPDTSLGQTPAWSWSHSLPGYQPLPPSPSGPSGPAWLHLHVK